MYPQVLNTTRWPMMAWVHAFTPPSGGSSMGEDCWSDEDSGSSSCCVMVWDAIAIWIIQCVQMVVRMTERDYLCPNCGIWNEKIQVSQIVADGLRSDCDNPCHPLYPLYPRGAVFELAHAWHDTYNNQIVISRRIHICRVGSLSYTFGSLRRSNFTYQAPADRQAPLFTWSGCLWLCWVLLFPFDSISCPLSLYVNMSPFAVTN